MEEVYEVCDIYKSSDEEVCTVFKDIWQEHGRCGRCVMYKSEVSHRCAQCLKYNREGYGKCGV
jgi:hypothetical protein